jgi:hypothetical protein
MPRDVCYLSLTGATKAAAQVINNPGHDDMIVSCNPARNGHCPVGFYRRADVPVADMTPSCFDALT